MAKAIAITWNETSTTPINLTGAVASAFVSEDVVITCTASPTGSISGWTLGNCNVYDRPGGTLLFSGTASITNSGTGVFTITFSSAQLAAQGPGIYWLSIHRTDSGQNFCILVGYFEVLPG